MTDCEKRAREIYKTTLVGSVVNLSLVFLKFLAGIVGRSGAMIADAVHSLTDLITDVVVIVFVRIAAKPVDRNHDFGHGKFETFATFVIGVMLVAVGAGIGYDSIGKIVSVAKGARLPAPGRIALAAALASIAAKEILFRYTLRKAKRLKSDALAANGWHHRSDALSSVGTAVGIGGALLLGSKWTILDPLAALFVSVLIVLSAWKILAPAVDELTEKSLPDEVEDEIASIVLSFGGVSDLHDLRTRKIGMNYAIEFHIRMDPDTSLRDTHDMVPLIERALREKYGSGTHIIVHMEPEK